MKLVSTYKTVIKEMSHVSDVVRAWSKKIFEIISKTNENEITINGKDVDPELYDVFSVDHFVITLNRNVSYGAGVYDEKKSGYKNGKYYVYMILPVEERYRYVINHELRHAYEDYKRQSKGATKMVNSKEGVLLFSGDFEKLMLNENMTFNYFRKVFNSLYLTSKLEESAYSETIYDLGMNYLVPKMKGVLNMDYVNDWKRTWKPEEMVEDWEKLKSEYKIPIFEKFNNFNDFLVWADKRIKIRGKKVLNKFLKIHGLNLMKLKRTK